MGLSHGVCELSRGCMWPFSLDYRVYAAGGMGLDLRPHNHLQHYDMLKDMWVSLAPMPTPRYAATSFLRGSKIYVLGKDGPSFLPMGHFSREVVPVCCTSPWHWRVGALPLFSGFTLLSNTHPALVSRGTTVQVCNQRLRGL